MNTDRPDPVDPADPPMQGEGNRTAARRYDEAQQAFVKSGKVPQAAEDAKPADAKEAEELLQAEREAAQKARG